MKHRPGTILVLGRCFYILFTNSLNLFPLSSKFLNKSKLALAGENKMICPFFATLLAFLIVSSNVSHL